MLMAFCLGSILYGPSLAGPRLFDDEVMLGDLGQAGSFAEIISSLNWMRPETRPIVRLTFAVEEMLFGDSMTVHRLANILIHVFAAFALFELVRTVCRQSKEIPTASSFLAADQTAFAVSILWFVHPLQSAAVAYVVQRGESLMGLFFFLYLLSVVKLITTRKTFWLVAAVIVFCLGLFSKTIMITAPLVGLLLDRAYFSGSWREVLRGQWRLMLFPAVGSAIAVALLLPGIMKGHANVGFGGDAPPIDLHLAAQAKILWLYVFQCVWPQWLSVDHSLRPPLYVTDHLGWILLSGALLLSIAVLYWRKKHAVVFLLLAPLCVLSVTSSVIPTADLWVDHRMYVPLACMMTLLVVGLRVVLTRVHGTAQSARILPVLVGILALLFSARTFVRAGDYSSGMRIWRSAIEENPDNDRAVQNLIDATRKESPEISILPVLNHALQSAEAKGIVPTVALGRLGEQYVELGEPEKAIGLLSRAIRLDDQYFSEGYRGVKRRGERFGMHVNLSLALVSLGNLSEGLLQVNEAFRFADGSADARALAGSLSLEVGEIKDAVRHFQRALELRPGWKEVESDLERIRQM
jgi:hypothetical protein